MKQKIFYATLLVIVLSFLSGCTTGGIFMAHNVTNVELSDTHYKFAARNLQGYSKAGYLFGVSFSTGFMANTLALVRVDGSATIYDDAVQDLWRKYKEKYGDMEGKKLVLVNIRYDTDILNLFVYTQTELYITADVVEFIE